MNEEIKKQNNNKLILIIAVILLIPALIYGAKNLLPSPISSSPVAVTPISTSPDNSPTAVLTISPRKKLFDKIQNRIVLSDADQQAKTAILKKLPQGQKAGIIYQTDTIRIEYVEALDLFKIEILTPNDSLAKTLGSNWFLQQGMSQEGICNLPLQFYLNFDMLQQNPELKNTFNPLPPGC